MTLLIVARGRCGAALLALASAALLAGCQHPPAQRVGSGDVRVQTDAVFDKLVALRRDLHQHPEPAGQEVRTAAKITAQLRALGLEVHTGLYGHSVVGILRGGQPGRTIAWRAELDALAGDYRDPAAFRSLNPGVHHACGHDVHMAVALGIAEVLAAQRASLRGTVVFVFQPEEETFRGAKALVDRDVFATTRPDEIYGLHVTALPVGQIVVRANEMFAHQRRLQLRLKDELSAAELQQLGQRVQAALARTRPGARPWELQNINDPERGLTVPGTAFQDYLIIDPAFDTHRENGEVVLEANLYETSAAALGSLTARVEQVVEAAGHRRALRSVSFVQANPTVLNHAALTAEALRVLQHSGSAESVRASFGQAPFFNDDFAYFQQQVPGVYFFLGGSNAAKGLVAMNHAPDFQVDEESIRVGVRSFSTLILARLGAPGGAGRE